MLDLLRDPLGQSIGVALAVAALGASFLIYSWQRSRRAVTYDVLSWTHLLTVREELAGKVQVLYEGEPAKSLTLLTVKVWNSGNQPLLIADFERPIAFRIDQESRILSAAIIETEPQGVSAEIETFDNAVRLKPALLNPTDSVTIKLLVRDMGRAIWPDARIVGVKSVTFIRESTLPGLALAITGFVLLAITVYFFVSALPPRSQRSEFGNGIYVGVFTFFLGYACMVTALVRLRHARRRNSRLLRPRKSGA